MVLAAAGRAHDGDYLAAADAEVNAAQGVHGQAAGAVGLVYVPRVDNEVFHRLSRLSEFLTAIVSECNMVGESATDFNGMAGAFGEIRGVF